MALFIIKSFFDSPIAIRIIPLLLVTKHFLYYWDVVILCFLVKMTTFSWLKNKKMKIFLKKKFKMLIIFSENVHLWIQGQRLKCQISLRTLNLLEIIYLQCLCKLIKYRYILSIKDKTCLILQIGVNKKYKKKMRQKSKIVSN